MVTLFAEPLIDNPSYFELAQYARKDEILVALKKIGFPMPKSTLKPELMCKLVNVFEGDPIWFANALPVREQKMLVQLVEKKQYEYIECDKQEQFLDLQNFYLVLTYEAGDKWHLYMPDYIRNKFSVRFEEELEYFLGKGKL